MLDLNRIKAITLDLDDTLWPVWPAIERAEVALQQWLRSRAPLAAGLFADPAVRAALREHVVRTRADLQHNLGGLRLETIRLALFRSSEDTGLAEDAFEVFFAERNRVTLFDDAVLALEFLSARYPVVALSNGNADIRRIGLAPYFKASISAQALGIAKPDARIFLAGAEACGVAPANILHVGDDAQLDVLGALGAGMQTAWLNRPGEAWTHAGKPHLTVTTLTELCDGLRAGRRVEAGAAGDAGPAAALHTS